MTKSLNEFNIGETIFVDANIFSFHHLNHQKFGEVCTKFLQSIENREINATTSALVIDEVAFVILIEKGCEILKTNKVREVKEKIKKDKDFARECYEAVKQFLSYTDFLREIGLSIIEIGFEDKYGIKNIATADSDFERVEEIEVWKPGGWVGW